MQIAAFANNGNDVIDMSLSTDNEIVSGLFGGDIITTGSGTDILNVDDGNDTLIGGASGNVLNGGAGIDTAS